MNHANRVHLAAKSNNPVNGNQNICALAVARRLKVDHTVRYLHVIGDLKRAASKRFAIRSMVTTFKKASSRKSLSVSAIKKHAKAVTKENGRNVAYIVWVQDHVLLIAGNGTVCVDTAPRKADRRKVLGVWACMYDPTKEQFIADTHPNY